MGWTVTIGEGGTAYTIAATARFDLQVQQQVSDSGDVQSVEWNILVEGDLVAATASLVADAMVALTEEVSEKFLARRIRLTLDGVDKYDLQPTDGFVGPFITLVSSEQAPGNGESRWKYKAQIFYRAAGNAGGGGVSAYNVSASVETEYFNSKVSRKTWKATATASNVAAAVAQVLQFAPSEPRVTTRIEKFTEGGARATGLWVWDARRSGDVIRIEETVRVSGGPGYVEQPLVDATPEVHRKRRRPWIIDITGVVIGYVPDLSQYLPPNHLAESETVFRDISRESFTEQDTEISSDVRGEYRLPYQQVWICTDATLPTLNHDGHNVITFADPPAD